MLTLFLLLGSKDLKGQIMSFSVFPLDSVCEGDQIIITISGHNLTFSDQIELLYNQGPLTITSINYNTDQIIADADYSGGSSDLLRLNINNPFSFPKSDTIVYKIKTKAEVTYNSTFYCLQSGTLSPPPNVTGGSATFSIGPNAIAYVDSITGEIDLNDTMTGNLSIFWTQVGCPNVTGNPDIILGDPTPSQLEYSDSIACKGLGSQIQPTLPNNPVGVFSSIPNGLSINSSNGFIDVDASQTGFYQVIYDPDDPCKANATFNFEIKDFPDPFFSYPDTNFCLGGSNPIPDSVITPGGSFIGGTPNFNLFPAVVDSITGEIDLQASYNPQFPFYLITYTAGDVCSDDSTLQLYIFDISAEYSIDTQVCQSSGGWIDASQITSPGFFLVQSPNNTVDSIPNFNGLSTVSVLDLGSSVPGYYTISYILDTSNGTCRDTVTKLVEVIGGVANIASYYTNTACELDGSIAIQNANINQSFFTPNASTFTVSSNGTVHPNQSQPGTYPIFQTTAVGGCADTTLIDSFTVTPAPFAQVTYGDSIFCMSGSDPSPTTWPTGGVFSSATIPIDPNTGQILLSQFTPPQVATFHTINYSPPMDSCARMTSVAIEVRSFDANFGYPNDSACQAESFFPLSSSSTFSGSAAFQTEFIFQGPQFGFLAIDPGQGFIYPDLSIAANYQVLYVVNDGHCQDTFPANHSLTIYESPSAFFEYSPNYCINSTNPSPDTIATAGGIFSATPASDIVIDSISGQIDLSQTLPGIYTISYDLSPLECPVTHAQVITIDDTILSVFNYPPDTVCNNGQAVFPQINQPVTIGTFQILSSLNLDMDSLGVIYPSYSDTGMHIIEHTGFAPCPLPFNDTLIILPGANPNFNYEKANYCETEMLAHVDSISTGGLSGIYSSSSGGLIIDPASGAVDLLQSTPGTYIINFTPTGGVFCPDTRTSSISITAYDSTTNFTYPADSFCQGTGILLPFLTGDSSGSFSSPSVVWNNSDSGYIDLDLNTPGEFVIVYQLGGVCEETIQDTIRILPFDTASFNYSDIEFCQNAGNPSPTFIATPGGTFVPKEIDLMVDPVSGEIDLRASALGPQTIYYVTNDQCTNTDSVIVDILPAPQELGYILEPGHEFCHGDTILLRTFSAANVTLYHNGTLIPDFLPPYEIASNNFQDGDFLVLIQTDGSYCQDTTTINLTVHPIPQLDLLDSTDNLSSGDPAYIVMQSDVDSVQFNFWSQAHGPVEAEPASGSIGHFQSFNSAQLPLELTSTSGLFPANITFYIEPEANNCKGAIDSVTFNVNPAGSDVFIPEVFTPDGDGFNDTWKVQWIESLDPNKYTIKLYNRSHGNVFSMNPIHPYWDGDGLPGGVYQWTLQDASGNVIDMGGLTLRRQ